MALVINKTTVPISYSITDGDTWQRYTLRPGYQITHSRLNGELRLKYDYNPNEKKIYVLQTTPIVGRTPSKADEDKAKVNYFQTDSEGNIHLFAQDDSAALNVARAAQAKAEQDTRDARAAQQKAEEEAREAKVAQLKAEKEARTKKDVWLVANLVNRTKAEMIYLVGDEKVVLRLPPKARLTIISKPNEDSLIIRVPKLGVIGPPTRLILFSTPVVGHTPTDFEKSNAVVNYLDIDSRNGVYLYTTSKPLK